MARDGEAGIRRRLYDERVALTLDAKQRIYDYIRDEIAAGDLEDTAIAVRRGPAGEKFPQIHLNSLSLAQLRAISEIARAP